MPIFNSRPPVPGSVELTEAERQAFDELRIRPASNPSSEENELSAIQFESLAKDIGRAMIDELLPQWDDGLNAQTAGSALGALVEIAYGMGDEQKSGPTTTAEFTIGVLKGAVESLHERQTARFNQIMQDGLE